MENKTFSEDIRHYTAILWHWAWLLALATLVAGAAAYIFSKQLTPIYQASTTMLINEAATTRTADYNSILTSQQLAQTYSLLMVKQPVLEGVIKELNLGLTPKQLKSAIDVLPIRDTQLIEVRVNDKNPKQAADIANTLVSEFSKQNTLLQSSRYQASKQSLETQLSQLDLQVQQTGVSLQELDAKSELPSVKAEIDRLQTLQAQYRQTYAYLLQSYEAVRLAEAQSTSNVAQAEAAIPPISPISPRPTVNAVLAAIVGLMLAGVAVFLVEALDDTIRRPDDVARRLGLPILGLIAKHDIADGDPITVSEPRTPVSEAFRSLRTNIQFASVDHPLKKLMITSPSPSDGKSTIAVNLAVVIAQGGRRVMIFDADLRRPRLHKMLQVANRRGATDLFVQDQIVLDGALQKTETPNLSVLTSGNLPPNPSELLGSEKMSEILRLLTEEGDIVIIDTPPVMAVTDASVLAQRVDGVLLVLKPGVTKLAAARLAVEQLRRVKANILGVVLNGVEIRRSSYYSYDYSGYTYSNYDGYDKVNGGSRRSKSRSKPEVKTPTNPIQN